MTLKATTSLGRERYIKALVDTGAEANLIRAGLFDSGEMRPSSSPLSLRTADGSVMRGGSQEVTLHLTFQGGMEGAKEWSVMAAFHDADLQVDAILGLPWLRQRQLGVIPHLEALVRWEEPQLLLKSVRQPEPRVIRQIRKEERRERELWARVDRVRAMNMTLPGGLEDVDQEADSDVFGEYEESLYEDEETLMSWAQEWAKVEKQMAKIQGVVTVPEGEHLKGGDVEQRITALHQDFEGKVLRDRIWAGDIERGPFGFGRIELKPGAAAVCRRPIYLTGERHDAMVAMVEEWERDGKVESGRSEWSSPAFVVAKKEENGEAWWTSGRSTRQP